MWWIDDIAARASFGLYQHASHVTELCHVILSQHQYRDSTQENLKLRSYIQRMEHKQRAYDKQMTEMLVSQATQIHLLQRQYGVAQETTLHVSSDAEQHEIDAFRVLIEQQQEKCRVADVTLGYRQDELVRVRAELAHVKACARYTKFEKIKVRQHARCAD